jgi:hypothetical protein
MHLRMHLLLTLVVLSTHILVCTALVTFVQQTPVDNAGSNSQRPSKRTRGNLHKFNVLVEVARQVGLVNLLSWTMCWGSYSQELLALSLQIARCMHCLPVHHIMPQARLALHQADILQRCSHSCLTLHSAATCCFAGTAGHAGPRGGVKRLRHASPGWLCRVGGRYACVCWCTAGASSTVGT